MASKTYFHTNEISCTINHCALLLCLVVSSDLFLESLCHNLLV